MDQPYDPAALLSLPALSAGAPALTLFAYAALALYALYALVLLYHWLRYALNPFVALATLLLYFGVSLPLAGALWLSARAL